MTILHLKPMLLSCKNHLLSFFVLLFITIHPSMGQKGLLWEISAPNIKTSYLFGTIHEICAESMILVPEIDSMIKHSDKLVMELDLTDVNVFNSMGTMILRTDGKTIEDDLGTEKFLQMEKFFKDSLNMSITMIMPLKPLIVQAMVAQKMMTCITDSYELTLLGIAKKYEKSIVGLETLSQQLGILDSIPLNIQSQILWNDIDDFNETLASMTYLQNAYVEQNLDLLDSMISISFQEYPLMQKYLINERNIQWTNAIKEMMKDNKVFIAVGAGHLAGEYGLLQLLVKEGYTIRNLSFNE